MVCGTAGWGKWLMEAALPGICDAQGGEAAARALAASRKPLIFPTLTVIRVAQESEQGGRCGVFPAAQRGRRAVRRTFPELLYLDSCTLCSSYQQSLELLVPETEWKS